MQPSAIRPFSVQKYCILIVAIQHFHFPLLPPGPTFSWLEGFSFADGDRGVCLHLWMEIFNMTRDVISVLMNTNDIDTHIAVRASCLQKQQIIILGGVFTVFVMSGSLLVADVSSV